MYGPTPSASTPRATSVSDYTNPTDTVGIASILPHRPASSPQRRAPPAYQLLRLAIDASGDVWIPYERAPTLSTEKVSAT